MSDIVVFKNDQGHLEGMGERGGRSYQKFLSAVKAMAAGDTLRFSWWKPRSPGFHKRFFAQLNTLFDMQDQFDDVDRLRAWLTVGAGECDLVPGPAGRMVALPKSIAWHKLDDVEFSELAARVWSFLWTARAQQFLWPHLSDAQISDIMMMIDR